MNPTHPKTYWWAARPNFGDLITPLLLARFGGIDAIWSEPESAHLVVAGSVLDVLPPRWKGIVAGSGKLHKATHLDLSQARVLGLRGALTAADVPGTYILGDPGLLVDEFSPRPEKKYKLGVVPHWTDVDLPGRFPDGHLIPAAQDPVHVINEIARCESIVASSLHGIVVADAFRIPRRIEIFAKASTPFEGGDYKFADYLSALGMELVFGKMQTPSEARVEKVQADLFEMFESLPVVLLQQLG